MAVLAGFSLIYLQGLFDQSDNRKAIAAVRTLQTHPGAPTFGGHLASTTGGAVTFSATLLSGCRGTVQVDAHLVDQGLLSYRVDLITQDDIEPLNGAAGRALDAYRARYGEVSSEAGEAPEVGGDPAQPEVPTPQNGTEGPLTTP